MRLRSTQTTILGQAREKGLARSARLGASILRTQAAIRLSEPGRRFVFVSHTVDKTGAAQVAIEAVEDFARRHGPRQVHLVADEIAPDERRRLRAAGVRLDGIAVTTVELAKLQLGLRRADFVLLNTVAVRDVFRELVLRSLETGQLEHAFWFIHEDEAQLAAVAPALLDSALRRRIADLLRMGRLTVLVPSEKMRRNYVRFFGTSGVETVLLRVGVDESHTRPRLADEYEVLNFLISGTPFDGRKGHPLALAAFHQLLTTSRFRPGEVHRDFSLTLIGIGEDPVSQQIRAIGESVLAKRLAIFPPVTHERALEITSGCNATICCSLNEAFGLYIAEGMAMGHVLLRNDSCGVDEQLVDGSNGYRIDSGNPPQFAAAIERLLDKTITSNSDLQAMGRASQEMIGPYRHHNYADPIEALELDVDVRPRR